MLYDDETDYGEPRIGNSRGGRTGGRGARDDGAALDPQELLEDLTALLDAGLIVPVHGSDGQVRVTPAEPLPWQERSCS